MLALFIFAGGVETHAQAENAPAQTAEAQLGAGGRSRSAPLRLLHILNLTPEQHAQIRAIRRETEPQGRLLGVRLRQARRALDEAIYSNNPDDGVIEDRVREVGAAQVAVLRLRTMTELKIRRVLSIEQLNSFRQLQSQSRTRQLRRNQTSTQGHLPQNAPERLRDRIQRRREELRRQQQPIITDDPGVQPFSTPRER
jgi:Spy/CpxP family protein refolding chaperone